MEERSLSVTKSHASLHKYLETASQGSSGQYRTNTNYDIAS